MPVVEEITEAAVLARLEIQRSLGRVEGKLDQLISVMASHEGLDKDRFATVNSDIERLDKRTLGLEKKIWLASGVVAVIAFIISHFPFSIFWK